MKLSAWTQHLKASARSVYYLADLCKVSGLSESSMRRAAQRLERYGLIQKIGKGIYLNTFMTTSLEVMSALLYRPSYISCESALFYHGILSQSPFVLTCVSSRPTKTMRTAAGTILYQQMKSTLFFAYRKEGAYFLAEPEKAMLDYVYLHLQNGQSVIMDEWDVRVISREKMKRYAQRFPRSVRERCC